MQNRVRTLRRFAAPTFALVLVFTGLATPPVKAGEPPWHEIHFPVEQAVTFSDDYGAPRSGGRTHEGNDLFGKKLDRLLATAPGKITTLRSDSSGLSGNMLTLTADDGWVYKYMHVNNDSPNTDDNLNPADWRFAPGLAVGTRVSAGQFIAYLGDSGNAEDTKPHLHFEMRTPDGTTINPWTSLRLAKGLPAGTRCAYPKNPKPTPSDNSGRGYWAVGEDGGVFTFGDVAFHGSTGAIKLNQPIVGMAATRTGEGYWLVAKDGGIFAFGDASFFGSTGAMKLNQPIVGMAPTASGAGYWLVAKDGGIFSFGDAVFHGSTGGMDLVAPVTAMAADPTGRGYWLVAGDGGMFTFGTSRYSGSLPGVGLCQWPGAKTVDASATGQGYWILGDDASVWALGDAAHHGGVNGLGLTSHRPIVDIAAAPPAPAEAPA